MNLKNNSYFLINFIFVIIIGVVLCYSYFFYPNNQPISCIYKLQTGLDFSSCGLSRAFSAFTHLKWEEGKTYNSNALLCFYFFLSQFVFRLLIIYIIAIHKKNIRPFFIWMESAITIILFIFTFYKFLL